MTIRVSMGGGREGKGEGGRSNEPAMTFIHEIFGRHIQTMFLVVTVKGPASSQNILSTAWCYKGKSEGKDEL